MAMPVNIVILMEVTIEAAAPGRQLSGYTNCLLYK